MQEDPDRLKLGWFTFRFKILLALLGVIFLMAGILLFVLQMEISIQLGSTIRDTVAKSQDKFKELENTWKDELVFLSGRYANSPRILAAFDAALEDNDPNVLAEAANYETKLAATSGYLFLFVDPEGRVICTLPNGNVEVEKKKNSWPVQNILPPEESFGYSIFGGQLYAVHTESLNFFSREIGYMLIGFPIREQVLQGLVEQVDGQVCFVVGSTAVVSTPGIARSALLNQMEAVAGMKEFRILTFSGQTWALLSRLLNPQEPGDSFIVYAIPLDKNLAPFRRIRTILILTALATMVAAVILGVFLSKGLAAPILELVRSTAKVARGNYDFQLRITSKDELGILENAFNSMLRDLLLKEKYRDVLDKAVSPEIAQEMLKGDLFLGGENRTVTILFADIRGFSAMTEEMDPREVITMLNDYLEGVSAAIETERGVVDKYVGDEIMALFGAPVSYSDDALRAVRAALRIRENICQLNQSRRAAGKPEIGIGIGINTGLVVAGNMGSKTRLNYTVLGKPVNLAARLRSMAREGQILISAPTLEAVGPVLDTTALDPVNLKGFSSSVGVWLVKGLKES